MANKDDANKSTDGQQFKQPEEGGAKVTETVESVPHVNEIPIIQPVDADSQESVFKGDWHLNNAGQITPGPKPPADHGSDFEDDNKKQLEKEKKAGWGQPKGDLNTPVVAPPPPTPSAAPRATPVAPAIDSGVDAPAKEGKK